MRPSMLPSLLQVAVTNINRGQKDCVFLRSAKDIFDGNEKETLAILLTGRRTHDWRSSKKDMVEIFDLKGILERIFQAVGHPCCLYRWPIMPVFDPGCAASININGK